MSASGSPVRERGGCLSLYLVLAFLGSVLGLVGTLTLGASLGAVNAQLAAEGAQTVSLPGWFVPGEVVLIILTLVAIYGIWTWKKWGVYVLIGTWIINILLGVGSGSGIGTSLLSLVIGGLLLWFVLRNKWQLFEG